MKLTCYSMRLPLKDPFTISRGTITFQDSLVVELEHDGMVGLGEVTANDFYGHSIEAMQSQLERLTADDLQLYIPGEPAQAWLPMSNRLNGDMFALSALDMAAHDLAAKRSGKSVWQLWNLQWNPELQSSFTIGIDSIAEMKRKLKAESNWSIYKIKLGTPDDLEIIRALRNQTDARFRVDANCSWTVKQTIENSFALKELGVEFIEQPLNRDAADADKLEVFQNSALPVIADEDCQTKDDVKRCLQYFHGINVKLCKCGGLSAGIEMLTNARAAGKQTMIGCMVESAIGISGAAQLVPLLDYADLDGANLISDAPAAGVNICNGKIELPQQPGTGATLDKSRLAEFAID